MSFAENLRLIRKEKNISQEELAFNAGLNLNSISTFERGINNIKIKNLQRIAIALEVGLGEIINCKF